MTSKKTTTNPGDSLSRVQVLNRQRRFRICRSAVTQYCGAVLRALDSAGPDLSVVFVNSGEMRAMNARYLGHDYATDVLSFCYEGMPVEGRGFLGEILVAPEVAARQAARYGMQPERELRKLLAHGILHLLGYNHETDNGQMKRLQDRLLRRKALSHTPSLIDVKGAQ